MFANIKFYWNGKTYQAGQEIPKDEFDPEDLAALEGAGVVSGKLALIPVEADETEATATAPAQQNPPAKRGGKKEKSK